MMVNIHLQASIFPRTGLSIFTKSDARPHSSSELEPRKQLLALFPPHRNPCPSPIWVYIPVCSHSALAAAMPEPHLGLSRPHLYLPLRTAYFYSDFYLHLWNLEEICGWWVSSQPQELSVLGGQLGRTPRHLAQRSCCDGL